MVFQTELYEYDFPEHGSYTITNIDGDSYLNIKCIMYNNLDGDNETLLRGELLITLRLLLGQLQFRRFIEHLLAPVLLFSLMEPRQGRILEAFFNGPQLEIRRTELYNFDFSVFLLASCIHELWWVTSSSKKWMNLGPTDTPACLPSGWAPSSHFSPGVCPSDYGVAKTMLVYSGDTTETIATCCPIAGSNTYSIRPSPTTGSTTGLGPEVCIWGPGSDTQTKYTYTWTGDNGSKSSTPGEMTSPGYFNAFGVEVRWQSTDFSSVPATASATTTSTSSTSLTPTSSLDSTLGTSSGLSEGSKAGIGIAAAAGVLAVLVPGMFCWSWWRKSRKKKEAAPVPQVQPSHDLSLSNMYLNEGLYDAHQGGAQRAELSTVGTTPFPYPRAELPNGPQRARPRELE